MLRQLQSGRMLTRDSPWHEQQSLPGLKRHLLMPKIFKDEGYYRIWKMNQLARGKKRNGDNDDEHNDHVQKKMKELIVF